MVGEAPERLTGFTRGSWNRDDDRRCRPLPKRGYGGPHGRAGSQAIVDRDGGAVFDLDRWALTAECRLLPDERLELPLCHLLELLRADPAGGHYVPVEDANVAGGDRAHGQLLVSWHPELSHHEDVKRSVQRRRDLAGYRDTPARQTENHHVLALRVGRELLRQATTRIVAIGEARCLAHHSRVGTMLMTEYAAMKAVLSDQPFSDPDWVFERKLDGERCGAVRRDGRAHLLSRTGRRLDATYPELVDALSLAGPDLLVDGEIVAFARGQASFERLQQRMGIHEAERARQSPIAVYYYLFDLLEFDGQDVRSLPLLERKALLRRAVEFRGHLRYTSYRRGDGETAFREACRRGWEGIIGKRADSRYAATRSRDWLKLKCAHGQELVVGGWTAPRGSRQHFGALLVGYYDRGRLRYAGKVGTGFDQRTLEQLVA